jgi:uncharacterized membrane protein
MKRLNSTSGESGGESSLVEDLLPPRLNGGMVLQLAEPGHAPGLAVIRQYSTTSGERTRFCLATSVLIFGIGLAFGILGAWPVLYFAAGLVAVIIVIWNELEQHRDDHEVVTFAEQTLDISVQHRQSRCHHRFQRYWVRAVCLNDGEHIVLRSHGRQVEVGVGLTKSDKQVLFRYLSRMLGRY